MHEPLRARREWLHVIVQSGFRNERYDIRVFNEPRPELTRPAAFVFWCEGALDAEGRLTEMGRRLVIEGVKNNRFVQGVSKDLLHEKSACIVWGPRRCTWIDGPTEIDGTDVPVGEPGDSGDWRHLQVMTLGGLWFSVRTSGEVKFVFLRRLGEDRIEVSSARPMRIGWWDVDPRPDESDPFPEKDENGWSIVPERFRGVRAYAMDDGTVRGPIQPDGETSILSPVWPRAVREACEKVAGAPFSNSLFRAVWRAIEDASPGSIDTRLKRVVEPSADINPQIGSSRSQ